MAETTVRENGNIRVVDVDGNLDSHIVAGDLRKELESLVSDKNYKLVVNLSNVEHISSIALETLVSISKQARRKDGDLKLYGLSDNIQRAFDLVGASKVLEIYDSESDAVTSF